jgi:predicted O-linked N-acetylglucosamine transferase (SPINDLY family)
LVSSDRFAKLERRVARRALRCCFEFDSLQLEITMATKADPFQTALGLHQAGNLAQAEQIYRQILQANPRHADALHQLGVVAHQVGRQQAAIQAISQAIALQPGAAIYHNNLGEAYRVLGRIDEARTCYEQALRLDPSLAAAHYNLGLTYGPARPDEARRHYEQAIALAPDHVRARSNLGNVLRALGLFEEAVVQFEEAIGRNPDFPKAYLNLGAVLHEQGNSAATIACDRRMLARWPDHAAAHSSLVFSMNFMDEYDPPAMLEAHLEWARRHAEPLTALAAPHDNDPTPDRRLRIGYVSPCFRRHAVNYFAEPLILAHDHGQFEIFLYSSVAHRDEVTGRLQASADQWRDVTTRNDEQLAQIVRDDQIDILVDLSGHMGWNRLPAFARRPAPIQVTYIGYQNTTGMSAMDYRLTDARADPPGVSEAFYTERLVRLPRSFFCYQPAESPEVSPLPALASGHVTFASFNNFAKVTPRVLDTWMELLARVPNSRLLMLAYQGENLKRRIVELAEKKGVRPDRIEVVGRRPPAEYLQMIQRADIGLDSFPFNGHTTTCDLAWMGVPVVMLQGQTYCSRFGGCVLAQVGLEHLIANSVEEYLEIAAKLAGDLPGLSRLRSELRGRMAGSVLLDFAGFARDVETAYRQMWIEWCTRRRPPG